MAGEDPRYSAWIKSLPCCAFGCEANAPSEQHYVTTASLPARTHDHESLPLCKKHRRAFNDGREPFMAWGPLMLRRWQRAMCRVLRAAYGEEPPF
jgi:hypothetical protein